jgi:hypothetical protein
MDEPPIATSADAETAHKIGRKSACDRLRAAVTTGWLGLPATRFLEALCPADSAADANFERCAGAPARYTGVHCAKHTLS